jgi:peroxiredoxin Q/BCP
MKKLLRLGTIATAIIGATLSPRPANAQELKVGDQAPDFKLPGTDGRTYSLAGLKGRHVVLAWFPKAFTGG